MVRTLPVTYIVIFLVLASPLSLTISNFICRSTPCASPRGSCPPRQSWGWPPCPWRRSPGWSWRRRGSAWPWCNAAWTPWWRSASYQWGSSGDSLGSPATFLSPRYTPLISLSHLPHTFRSVPPPDEAGWVVDEVVVDPVLAADPAALLGRHVTGDDEVAEGSVIVLQVLSDYLSVRTEVRSSELVATQDSWIWTLACPQWWRPRKLMRRNKNSCKLTVTLLRSRSGQGDGRKGEAHRDEQQGAWWLLIRAILLLTYLTPHLGSLSWQESLARTELESPRDNWLIIDLNNNEYRWLLNT